MKIAAFYENILKGAQKSGVNDREALITLYKQFVEQLTDKELGDLTRGEGGKGSALGVVGNAGAFGGITEELRAKGIPSIITADGPSGLRVKKFTSLMPCGTAIACTWNTELVEQLFQKEGQEAKYFGVDVTLSPGMNIHRDPLCGRNFEYYSEDPLLTYCCRRSSWYSEWRYFCLSQAFCMQQSGSQSKPQRQPGIPESLA